MIRPSPWLERFVEHIPVNGQILDLACGSGRHARWLAARGYPVLAVDRDAVALAGLQGLANVTTEQLDLEVDAWPLAGRRFAGIVVTNYLWRALWPDLLATLAPGGVYIHETFAHGNASVGKPSRPAFLLQPGELLQACAGLRTIAYEDGFCAQPDRYVQRIVAVREGADTQPDAPPRYPLHAPD